MKTLIQINKELQIDSLQPYKLAELAVEISNQKNNIDSKEYDELQKLFLFRLHSSNNAELIDNKVDYATRIMNSDTIMYEELIKLYSIFQECIALKNLGLNPQVDLDEFYKSVKEMSKKHCKSLNEVERKFKSNLNISFSYEDCFLG